MCIPKSIGLCKILQLRIQVRVARDAQDLGSPASLLVHDGAEHLTAPPCGSLRGSALREPLETMRKMHTITAKCRDVPAIRDRPSYMGSWRPRLKMTGMRVGPLVVKLHARQSIGPTVGKYSTNVTAAASLRRGSSTLYFQNRTVSRA